MSDTQLTTVADGRSIAEALEQADPGSIVDLPIPGAWVYVPRVFGDDRGSFHEAFRGEQFTEKLGYPLNIAQTNLSRSGANVIRGIHLAEVPPGQAKLVTCVAGGVTDVLVDVRVGSPTFGKHLQVPLNEQNNFALFVPLGVGHGVASEHNGATLYYLVTEAYDPDREFGLHPFDAALNINWPVEQSAAVLSPKDATAPTVDQVRDRLSSYNDVRGWEKELRRDWAEALAESEAWSEPSDNGGGRNPSGERGR
ncbi:dTDP-4-dehydrorhamnose 3,5-epimerase family protein [Corynebacterium auriscanis]|uniref:dTDP-4-dehydrorhamnose 3,5-epimerase family protein n=1 Tax=Corynebacterium auriscanis TaxID=99807 RepID=UPI003CFA8856